MSSRWLRCIRATFFIGSSLERRTRVHQQPTRAGEEGQETARVKLLGFISEPMKRRAWLPRALLPDPQQPLGPGSIW
jgi:hypothetical protein